MTEEQQIIDAIQKMCEQNISPETLKKWNEVRSELEKNLITINCKSGKCRQIKPKRIMQRGLIKITRPRFILPIRFPKK